MNMAWNIQTLFIFLVLFLSVTLGVPFILATFLPTVEAMLGSIGITVVTGIILFYFLGYAGKEASPTS